MFPELKKRAMYAIFVHFVIFGGEGRSWQKIALCLTRAVEIKEGADSFDFDWVSPRFVTIPVPFGFWHARIVKIRQESPIVGEK